MTKISKFMLVTACCLGFVACSDDNEPAINPDVPSVAEGAFVLSQGTYGYDINGSLTLIDYNATVSSQGLFQKANGRILGDTPQGALVYGDKIYIAVYASNVIQVIDRNNYKSIKQISLANETGQDPRSLVAKDGKVYISMYNGYVSRLDTLSLAIDNTVQVGPNPEIMAIKGNSLYVPNSDGMNWMNGYGTTATKIDLATFKVDKTLTVGLNPAQFASNGTDLFLLCKGNYGDVPSTIYKVVDDSKLEKIAEATLFSIKANKLYYINAPWGADKIEYSIYDIPTGKISEMLADNGVDSPAGLGVDPVNGNIVITSNSMDNGYASYTTNGYAKVYDASGNFIRRYDVGVSPCAVFFNYK